MTYPSYIKLTVTKVTMPGNRPGLMQTTHLQPPVVKLFPLPMGISRQQTGEPYAEVSDGPGITLTCAEHFDDVVAAIEEASSRGDVVVKPIQREAIAAAVAGSVEALRATLSENMAAIPAALVDAAQNVGTPRTGDLRIVPAGDNWQVEYRVVDEDGNWEWTRNGPALSELRATFETREAAVEAVRVAGYIRRLVSE